MTCILVLLLFFVVHNYYSKFSGCVLWLHSMMLLITHRVLNVIMQSIYSNAMFLETVNPYAKKCTSQRTQILNEISIIANGNVIIICG